MSTENKKNMSAEAQEALAAVKMADLRKKINAASWNDNMENLMKTWGEKAAGNRELHDKAAKKWKRFSEKMYVPMIALTTIAGVTNFGAADSDYNKYWMYVVGVINIITSFIASVIKYYKPDEKIQEHSSVAKSFGSYYRMMTLELSTSREDRMSPEEITKWAKSEYDRMLKDAPSIPSDVIKEYKNKHKDDDNIPDCALDSYNIKVYGRENEISLPIPSREGIMSQSLESGESNI